MASLFPKIYLYRRIVLAKLFIDEHYAQPINLDMAAGEAYFSKFHFIRLFKKAYGKTPHQYLTTVRIDRAKLLLSGDASVADVCIAVGFDEISSFTHLFKRITSMTPAAYQQARRQRQRDITAAPLRFIPNCFAEQKGWTEKSNFQQVR